MEAHYLPAETCAVSAGQRNASYAGQLKRALQDAPGAFRATFEDKILLRGSSDIKSSWTFGLIGKWKYLLDIVFLRTWAAVPVPEFYSVVDNLMRPQEERERFTWLGLEGGGRTDVGLGGGRV